MSIQKSAKTKNSVRFQFKWIFKLQIKTFCCTCIFKIPIIKRFKKSVGIFDILSNYRNMENWQYFQFFKSKTYVFRDFKKRQK